MKAFQFSRMSALLAGLTSGGMAAAATVAAVAAGVPAPASMGLTELAAYIGGGTLGIVAAGMKLRAWLSRSGVDMKADSYLQQSLAQSKVDQDSLRAERDRAMQDARTAWASKTSDALELGQLRAENAFLKRQLEEQSAALAEIRRGVQSVGQRVDALKGKTDETQARISSSGIAPLGET